MNLKSMRFGLRPQEKDDRDFDAKTLGIDPSEIISHIELELPSFVYNQGQSDMCTAFSSAMMMTILNKVVDEDGNTHFPLEFSRADLYAQKSNQGEGANLRDILKKIRNRGISLRYLYDVTGTFEECKIAYEQNKIKADALSEIGRVRYFYQAKSDEDIMKALELGIPLIGGVDVYTDFIPDSDGYIHELNGKLLGGHAILVVGIKEYNGKVYLKILNSWSEDWGVKGTCWLPSEMVKISYVPVDANMKVKNIQMQIGTDFYVKNGQKFYMTGLDENQNEVPVAPFIKDGRTCLPVKFVADAFEAEVDWNPIGQIVTISG